MEQRDAGAAPRRSAPEAVRREQILRAAYEVASREGIGGLTIRAVAGEAEVSHALVLFHFKRKQALVNELLDWLMDTTSFANVPSDTAHLPRALDRLHSLLHQEMARLTREPRRTRLFFEFWALGARQPRVRARISVELERSRAAFRTITEELLVTEPAAFAGVTADALATVAVSWIYGCAVQAMNDPESFDTGEFVSAVRGLVGKLEPSG